MKQPHEDVVGIVREDDLLSLDAAAVAHRDALISMAQLLSSACLVGHPAPIVERMGERIRKPQAGDLVIEVSAMRSRDPDKRITGFGILLEHRAEWWQTDEEYAAQVAEDPADDERLIDHAWYVQYGPSPGDVCRWTNCEFVVIPTDPRQFERSFGQQDGAAVIITRDDVVSELADSGFTIKLEPNG
jgi:hypothetical protein